MAITVDLQRETFVSQFSTRNACPHESNLRITGSRWSAETLDMAGVDPVPLCLLQVRRKKNGMIICSPRLQSTEPADSLTHSLSWPSKSSWPAQSLQRPWPGIKPGGSYQAPPLRSRLPRGVPDVEARSEDPGLYYPGVAADDGCQDRSFFVHCQIPISGLDFLLVGSMGKHGKTFFEIPNPHAISIGFPHVFPWFPCRLFDDVRFQAIDRDDDREVTWEEPLDRHWAAGQLDASAKTLENIQKTMENQHFCWKTTIFW